MIESILKDSGIPFRQGKYLGEPSTQPMEESYAVYFDDVEIVDKPDFVPGLDLRGMRLPCRHDVMVELYEPTPDPEAEENFENACLAQGVVFEKQDRIWLPGAQRYQVVYDITYMTKR